MENIRTDVQQAQLETNTSINLSADENDSVIADTITQSLEKNFPTLKKRFRRDRHSLKPWMTDTILAKIRDKDKLYIKVRKSKPESINHKSNQALLKEKISEIKQDIREAKKTYYARQIEKYKGDAKKTWGTIF